MIRSHLRRASHHWNLTNRLDVSRRLETELRLYRTRIDEYASLWKDAVYKVPVLPEKQATTQQSNARNEKPKKRSL